MIDKIFDIIDKICLGFLVTVVAISIIGSFYGYNVKLSVWEVFTPIGIMILITFYRIIYMIIKFKR